MDPDLAKTLAGIISMLLDMVKVIIFASIIISWVGDRSNQIVQIIESIAAPIYKPFRPLARMIPGPIDFSPIIILIVIYFIEGIVVAKLYKAGMPITGISGP